MLLVPSLKKKTRECPITRIEDPEDFYMPMESYKGILVPLVENGEQVCKYQLLAETSGSFPAKMHSPVSGKVVGMIRENGKEFLHVRNDFQETEAPVHLASPASLDLESFVEILLDRGIVGAGGARLPTQLKYQNQGLAIHTIIFNGAECEPYLSADYAVMESEAFELIEAAKIIKTLVGAKLVVFAIETQNRKLKKILLSAASKAMLQIEVKLLPDTYPQGGELQIIRSVTGLELRKGTLPTAHGILVNNIGTLRAIYHGVFEGKPYVERVVTVSGDRSQGRGNYLVKIGTPVGHVLRHTGNDWKPGEQMVISGGAMMGVEIESPLFPIHKGTGGLLILRRKSLSQNNCIKCGVCVDVCPQRLMPLEFARAHTTADVRSLAEHHLMDCIECGACAYACPSDVPLMESIFAGKRNLMMNPQSFKS